MHYYSLYAIHTNKNQKNTMQLCISQFSYENLFHQILTCKFKKKGGGGMFSRLSPETFTLIKSEPIETLNLEARKKVESMQNYFSTADFPYYSG